jgi:hypothetical protein
MGAAVDGVLAELDGGGGVWAQAGETIPMTEIKTSTDGTRRVINISKGARASW